MMRKTTMKMLATVLALLMGCEVEAWTAPGSSVPKPKSQGGGHRRRSSVMYAPSNMPTTETPSFAAQKILQHTATSSKSRAGGKSASLSLSQSVLASCDTLPSFPTSHGLLSPETVMRMEELMATQGETSEALVSFVKTYRRHGPMSCLPMLSDPDILPHLTRAMRESMV